MVDINDLTLGQLTEISNRFGGGNKPIAEHGFFEIGKNYFIRTVTHHYTGHLVGFDRGGLELIMNKCSWIASDGRFSNAIRDGILDEVEPYPAEAEVLINRETIIDTTKWTRDLPGSQK